MAGIALAYRDVPDLRVWIAYGWLFDADYDPHRMAVIVAGHNLNALYQYQSRIQFEEEPDFIDGMTSLYSLDTDHAGCVSEVLQAYGPIYTIGAACASGNLTLRSAVDEIRHHGAHVALVVGAVLEFAPVDVHAMAIMGAISYQSFNDEPSRASRPYDVRREGFVPAHSGATLVLEELEAATRRGARIYAEVLGCAASSDGNHLPLPSEDGQTRVMGRFFETCGIKPDEVDYVNAHATSTPLGDLTELRSIKNVFGDHARKLKINAPKSMLGHTCWSAPTVEAVAALLQMQAGRLHRSINVDELEPTSTSTSAARGRSIIRFACCSKTRSASAASTRPVSGGGTRDDERSATRDVHHRRLARHRRRPCAGCCGSRIRRGLYLQDPAGRGRRSVRPCHGTRARRAVPGVPTRCARFGGCGARGRLRTRGFR